VNNDLGISSNNVVVHLCISLLLRDCWW
jgi:hypothetical protein